MTSAPIAYTVHDGHGMPPNWRRELIAAWLTANDVDPKNISPHHPISILTVPFREEETADGGPWMLQVIVLHQYYVNANGSKEQDLIAHKPVMFQRTVPLKVPFPADSATADEGEVRGEAEGQAAQEAPQEVVRPAREEGVPHPRQGARPRGAVEGEAARHQGAAEEGPRRGHQAVPGPEEVRQEEVGDR